VEGILSEFNHNTRFICPKGGLSGIHLPYFHASFDRRI
jgi:hypothetical protein